jgi:hypothetical protein
MTRILITLASVSVVLLIAAMLLGMTVGDLYTRPHPDSDILRWATVHRLTGVAAALVVVFVECVIVTYFIGTSRWCREVVETYGLNSTAAQASNRLKRKTFPWVLVGMLTVVGVIALGAAADPATGRPGTQSWAEWHFFGAAVGIAVISWTYVVAWNNVVANHAIIEQLVRDVAEIRRERGLDPNDAPASVS